MFLKNLKLALVPIAAILFVDSGSSQALIARLPEAHIKPPLTLRERCVSEEAQIFTQTFHFNKTPEGTCDNSGGGTRKLDAFRHETRSFAYPEHSEVCGLNLRIPNTSFEYDDEFALVYDNTVLVSSYYDEPTSNWQSLGLSSQEFKGVHQYSEDYIRGFWYDWGNGSRPYCVSPQTRDCEGSGRDRTCTQPTRLRAESCKMPTGKGATAIKKGKLDVELNPEAWRIVFEKTRDLSSHEIKMQMYGNGVTTKIGDCFHSAFDLVLEVSYLP